MNGLSKKLIKRILAILLAVLLVGGVAHAVYIDVFNKTEHSTSGADETQATYIAFNDRDDSTSAWVKRDYDLRGKKVDLQAQTVDGTLVNNSDDVVASWEATINIQDDCFINNAWVGTVEIHQYVGTEKEAVQTIDLRNYELDDIELDYLYDGDLLIPLAKGDLIIYHPSETDELVIAPHGELTMGMIFYYLKDLNLADHTISYFYHRDFTYGAAFIALAVLAILWVLLLAGTVVAGLSYRRAIRETDLRKSGLASMSSIYSIISFIDLRTDELTPVYTNEKTEGGLPQGAGAASKLHDLFSRDVAAPYRAAALEFIDLGTIRERLEKESIAFEYESKAYGWSRVRFFAVDRTEGQPLERVLLTIQDINDEKRELKRFEQHSAEVELEINARSIIVAGVASKMRPPVQAIDELAEKIMAEAGDEQTQAYAKQIRKRGKVLTFLIDSALDSSRRDGDELQAVTEEYSFPEMISDACDVATLLAEDREIALETEVSPSIPDRLVGDARRIERALIEIFAYVTRCENTANAKISVFGTKRDDGEHLLFSVKADGAGMAESEAQAIADFVSNVEKFGAQAIDDEIKELEGVASLLMFMGSKLQVVNEPGEGLELYFEIEQQVAGSPSASEDDIDA